MRNSTQKTTQVVDLPLMVSNAADALELGTVRLTTCLHSINRLNDLIPELNDPAEMSKISSEIGLMLEKCVSIVDEINSGTSEGFSSFKLFLDTQFANF